MKKIIFLALLLTSITAYSQTIQLGVKGGVNISNYTGGNMETDALVGFHLGGFINFLAGDNFSIQPEVLFSSQGARYNDAGNKSNLKVSYIIVPVMAKIKFNGGFYVEVGPQVGFKAGEDAQIPNQTIDHFAKNLDLSIGAGLGYHGESGFGIGARYMAGLSKVGDFNISSIDPDFKNSVIQVSLFFTLFNNK